MPDNIKTLIDNVPPSAWASAIMAAALAMIRILGDSHSKKWQRILLEMPTAGCIGMTVMMASVESGLGPWSSVFLACMVGHVGTDYVRVVARRIVDKKVIK